MNLEDAIKQEKDNLLPNIYIYYKVNIYRVKGENGNYEYIITLSFADNIKDNYFGFYEAGIYSEKQGKVAEYFTNCLN